MMWVFLNDRFVPQEQALISVFDHGFLYGDGIYETLRAYDGRIFKLQQHLRRLHRSAELIGLTLPREAKEWPALLHDVMDRNQLRNAYLRITVSRGPGSIGLDPRLCAHPTVVVIAQPLPTYPPELFRTGVALAIVHTRRNHPEALSPQIKSLNFLNNILAKQDAIHAQAFDGLMVSTEGYLAECTTSNVFFVGERGLSTPSLDCGILDGITRDVVLTLAREDRIATAEGRYRVDDLLGADECFLTNTTLEVMPVRTVDGLLIGSERPGPITCRLQDLFRRHLPRFLE